MPPDVRRCHVLLTGLSRNEVITVRDIMAEQMTRQDTEYDQGEYCVMGPCDVIGTTTFNNLFIVDKVITPLLRATVWPDDFIIWAYNPRRANAQKDWQQFVTSKWGPQGKNAEAFFDPVRKVAYCPAYVPVIKHEWTHLIYGFWHGNNASYG